MTSGIRNGEQPRTPEQKKERARIAARKRYLLKTGRQPDGKPPKKYGKRKIGPRIKVVTFNVAGIQCDLSLTGVYAIQNTVNNKVYIGSAAKNFKSRWKQHRNELNGGSHHNRHLQAAWKKYGEQTFVFIVLELTQPQHCVNAEQKWIDQYDAANAQHGYNICTVAGSTLGVKHSDEARKRQSERQRGRSTGVGRKHSDITKDRIRKAITGTKHSEQHNTNLGNALKGRKQSKIEIQRRRNARMIYFAKIRCLQKTKQLTLF